MTIDEDSPIAPLLQAALYLRLGDQELAFDLYSENVDLFDEHREQMPVDLVDFVVNRLIAAGGDDNFNYVEDLVRTWLVKNSESEEVSDDAKATMQLLLAENYFKARRFDIARSEYTTVVNRYPESEQALEAQFGIGESFMEQKVFDQAQQVFDKLANSNETLIVVRAEFSEVFYHSVEVTEMKLVMSSEVCWNVCRMLNWLIRRSLILLKSIVWKNGISIS